MGTTVHLDMRYGHGMEGSLALTPVHTVRLAFRLIKQPSHPRLDSIRDITGSQLLIKAAGYMYSPIIVPLSSSLDTVSVMTLQGRWCLI